MLAARGNPAQPKMRFPCAITCLFARTGALTALEKICTYDSGQESNGFPPSAPELAEMSGGGSDGFVPHQAENGRQNPKHTCQKVFQNKRNAAAKALSQNFCDEHYKSVPTVQQVRIFFGQKGQPPNVLI